MVTLENDQLSFRFTDVHPDAKLQIEFQRTLRIPDDNAVYSLPPGLGQFPLRHVDDHADRVPKMWAQHGGVMLPMYQSEALWISFSGGWSGYPFAVKVATGKINAVTGDPWADGLHGSPQDYVVSPDQPWLDGYCVTRGEIRQFVAMPLGSGYSAEEQITGEAEHGGIQIIAYPMKAERYEKMKAADSTFSRHMPLAMESMTLGCVPDMGLAPGGRMRQEIYDDEYGLDAWDMEHPSRCFVHIANSLVWSDITGTKPPTTPPTAREYTDAGLPWFEYYDDGLQSLEGGKALKRLKSVLQMATHKGDVALPENQSVIPEEVIEWRRVRQKGQVREGRF